MLSCMPNVSSFISYFMISLFDPLQLGAIHSRNRVIMAPLTRSRASDNRVPNDMMRSYYCQRASAGLIIAEATSISPQGVGYPNTPGIWCRAQVSGWRKITDAVHKKEGKIILQLWHVGRVSDPELLHGQIPVAPSAVACPGSLNLPDLQRPYVTPRALHPEEIESIVADFADAAAKAREAGFDGVSVHAANGYLIDQFLHDGSNQRQDNYGGSLENRCRFLKDVVDACIGVWGADRVGVHLSPYGTAHGMHDSNPPLLFNHIAQMLGQQGVAFMFVREAANGKGITATMKRLFGGKVIVNQDYDHKRAAHALSTHTADAVAFGRPFISNPDLAERFQRDVPLNDWDSTTFYSGGAKGYIDYPFLKTCCPESSECSS